MAVIDRRSDSKGFGQVQMVVAALLLAAATVASAAYIVLAKPAYLRATRFGVPFYSPKVINPVDGRPMSLNTLAGYYVLGKTQKETK